MDRSPFVSAGLIASGTHDPICIIPVPFSNQSAISSFEQQATVLNVGVSPGEDTMTIIDSDGICACMK